VYDYIQIKIEPKGASARRIRRRKDSLLVDRVIPSDALPGSLAQTHRRCGKANCHCAEEKGHPIWSLTFMAGGKKRVERIPEEWVDYVRQRVEEGRGFKEVITEIFNANAELLILARKDKRR
jgi:hypothetical protein